MNNTTLRKRLLLTAAVLTFAAPAMAQDAAPAVQNADDAAQANADGSNVVRDAVTGDIIYVYGRGERRIGIAGAA